MRHEDPTARDVAAKELREVVASTEALLAALGNDGGEAIGELRERLTVTIADLKKELGTSFIASAREKFYQARDTATSVDNFVHRRPWSSVVIGAGIGVVIGLILKD
jgi:ElaB/YqjD/DUF883 family membrane-anchored ribosome-binding protein